jgi:uncharacterized protein YndB with AHSA1/START domain
MDVLALVLDGDAPPKDAPKHWESISHDASVRYTKALQNFDGTSPAPFVIERVFDAPVSRVWKALTVRDHIGEWFMDLDGFEPEEGYEFTLVAEHKDKRYVHLCRVMEVIEQQKLSYSFRFQNTDGITYVTWELFPEGRKTRLRLTHEGLEKIAHAGPDYGRKNFAQGWTSFFDQRLVQFLQRSPMALPR